MKRRLAILSAVLGFTGVVLAAMIDGGAALLGWLVAVATMAALASGALGMLLVTYLVRGRWTEELHVPLTAAALTCPIAALLFLPVLFGLSSLYPWVNEGAGQAGSFKSAYLTPWFFALRTVGYFTVWTALGLWARSAWGDPRRMVASASAGLIAFTLTSSLAGIDWFQSLTPEFHSSLYGVIVMTHQVLGGFALALLAGLAGSVARTRPYSAILLTLLMLWSYNHAMQYIIIWSGNIPEEVTWYLAREHGVWGGLFWTLMVAQFVVPFFLLLFRRIRADRRVLMVLAAATLVLRAVESTVLAAPRAQVDALALGIAIPSAMLLAGSVMAAVLHRSYLRLLATPHDTQHLSQPFDAAGNPAPS